MAKTRNKADKEVMKSIHITLLLLIPLWLNAADIIFSPQDLSTDNQLLFTCTAEQPGWSRFQTGMIADLDDLNDKNNEAISVLSYFPELVSYYPDTRELEILNRFGLFRSSFDKDYRFRHLEIYTSYKQGFSIPNGRILPTIGSPDGQWLLLQETNSSPRGNLYLANSRTGKKYLITSEHVTSFRPDYALWSEDSSYVIYSHSSKLYYLSIQLIENNGIPNENYREFGTGKISSVKWVDKNTLYYLSGSLVIMINPAELPTRSFYLHPLSVGNIVGRIPLDFDPGLDDFSPSPDGTALLFIKDGQKLFRIPLGTAGGEKFGKTFTLPSLQLPRYMKVRQLWWGDNGDITLLVGGSQRSDMQSLIYQLKENEGKNAQFKLQSPRGIKKIFPSPDGTILATLNENGVTLVSADNFREIKFISHPDPRSFLWMDDDQAVIAGGKYIETVDWSTNERTFITLSEINDIGFDIQGNIVAVNNGKLYHWHDRIRNWREIARKEETRIRSPKMESQSYRIYDNVQPSSLRFNHIMVRKVNGFGNRSLFNAPPLPHADLDNDGDELLQSAYDQRIFDHGSRTRRREVALVFNAIDNDEGLGDVLNILMDYDIRATFFVGGDFIRQNPDSTKVLAATRHEIGSLFYTHMDMADYRYRIDKNFVIRGLGRNEDDYFRVTNSEISTLWHAPWYVVSPPILDASVSMNYLYVGRDVDPLDWVTFDTLNSRKELYMPSLELIEKILNDVKPGSIVPIRIGKPGKREDYLFNQLELLINSLLWNGYDIVSIGELKEHSL